MDDESTITQLSSTETRRANRPEKVDNLTVVSSSLSDIGKKRKVNEDSFYSSDENQLWVVADGMGGHNAGDIASQTVIKYITEYTPQESLTESLVTLEQIIHKANDDLVKKAAVTDDATIIGSTLVLLATHKSDGIILWAGDSRIYRIRMNEIEPLTTDHSYINKLIKQGNLDPNDTENFPESNKITRAVGFKKNLNLDHRNISILPGDRYILCSDGLTKYIDDAGILEFSQDKSPAATNEELVQTALDSGGSDNITSIIIDFSKG